jgi:hypothetical protein
LARTMERFLHGKPMTSIPYFFCFFFVPHLLFPLSSLHSEIATHPKSQWRWDCLSTKRRFPRKGCRQNFQSVKMAADSLQDTTHSTSGSEKKKKAAPKQATVGETLGFAFGCGRKIRFLFVVGMTAGIMNGAVYPSKYATQA